MATINTSSLVGPVPFKDVDDGDAILARPPREFDDIVSALPRKRQAILELRRYEGFWLTEHSVPGVIVMQRRFTPRRDDVLLVSYPKCGTTWLKALAFVVMTRDAYPLAAHPLLRLNPHDCVPFLDDLFADGREAKLDALPSPRLMNTHMPHSLLPESVTGAASGCRIVYICRDSKDMVVSLWHFLRRASPDLSFSDTFESVCDGAVASGPIWDHALGYWKASKTQPEKVLFLKYEDMLQDPVKNLKKLAEFIGRPFSDAEDDAGVVTGIVELCSFDKMRGLEVNKAGSAGSYRSFPRDSFFRKGVIGDWVNYMSPEMARRLDEIVGEKFRGTGLNLP